MKNVEQQAKAIRESSEESPKRISSSPQNSRTTLKASRADSVNMDPVQQLINNPELNMFFTNETDESSLIPVSNRRSFVDDICFGEVTFEDCLATLDRLLSRFEECRISVIFTKSIFVQSRVGFRSHEVSREGIEADVMKLAAILQLEFPTTKRVMQSFLGALNYYGRFIQDFAVYGAALYQLKDEDFAPGGDLTTARRSFDALKKEGSRSTDSAALRPIKGGAHHAICK
ncbi:hypothetical protein PC128_g21524 [Phytophthora cactorum]|nr:hypothetical protein PC120_g22548 [Phytophthora cactorum]KAG3158374.1 hypothetical protein PC128_g21524 [Phytophthora cactorum]KAG4043281.1 hypothetical protein PC123_g21241 [Phytophthora cactorum]